MVESSSSSSGTTSGRSGSPATLMTILSGRIDGADLGVLRRATKAALAECDEQRASAGHHGPPDSAVHRTLVRALENVEEAIIDALGAWPAIEQAIDADGGSDPLGS
jgi:hypothetical protein